MTPRFRRSDWTNISVSIGFIVFLLWSFAEIGSIYWTFLASPDPPLLILVPLGIPLVLFLLGTTWTTLVVARTDPFEYAKRPLAIALVRSSIILAAVLSVAYLAFTFLNNGRIAWLEQYPLPTRHRLTVAAHLIALQVVVVLALLLYMAKRKLAIKTQLWGRFIALQREIARRNPWQLRPRPARDVLCREIDRQIESTLAALAATLDLPSNNYIQWLLRTRLGIPRLFSIWQPANNESRFSCTHCFPTTHSVYQSFVRNYRPPMHNEHRYAEFVKEWHRSPLDPTQVDRYKAAKAEVTSLAGALWDGLGPAGAPIDASRTRIYVSDVRDFPLQDPYFEWSHEEYLDESHIQSEYIRLLSAGDQRVALLIVIDPLPHGLTIRDEDYLEAYGHLLEVLLLRRRYFAADADGKSDEGENI